MGTIVKNLLVDLLILVGIVILIIFTIFLFLDINNGKLIVSESVDDAKRRDVFFALYKIDKSTDSLFQDCFSDIWIEEAMVRRKWGLSSEASKDHNYTLILLVKNPLSTVYKNNGHEIDLNFEGSGFTINNDSSQEDRIYFKLKGNFLLDTICISVRHLAGNSQKEYKVVDCGIKLFRIK